MPAPDGWMGVAHCHLKSITYERVRAAATLAARAAVVADQRHSTERAEALRDDSDSRRDFFGHAQSWSCRTVRKILNLTSRGLDSERVPQSTSRGITPLAVQQGNAGHGVRHPSYEVVTRRQPRFSPQLIGHCFVVYAPDVSIYHSLTDPEHSSNLLGFNSVNEQPGDLSFSPSKWRVVRDRRDRAACDLRLELLAADPEPLSGFADRARFDPCDARRRFDGGLGQRLGWRRFLAAECFGSLGARSVHLFPVAAASIASCTHEAKWWLSNC
jgi:hypothetical protein